MVYTHTATTQCVLGNFQYGHDHNIHLFCNCWLYLEWIWNNYIDIQQKSMQVRLLWLWVPRDITKFGVQTCLNTNWSELELCNQISWSLISVFLFYWFCCLYNITTMIHDLVIPIYIKRGWSLAGMIWFAIHTKPILPFL